jgi:hypothetical protein
MTYDFLNPPPFEDCYPGCGHDFDDGPPRSIEEENFYLECWECSGFYPNKPIRRKVVKEGKVVNAADPTQTYILECGHTTF